MRTCDQLILKNSASLIDGATWLHLSSSSDIIVVSHFTVLKPQFHFYKSYGRLDFHVATDARPFLLGRRTILFGRMVRSGQIISILIVSGSEKVVEIVQLYVWYGNTSDGASGILHENLLPSSAQQAPGRTSGTDMHLTVCYE